MPTTQEQIEAQQQKISQLQQSANIRIRPRTIQEQFRLGKSAFEAEKKVRETKRKRSQLLGELSLARGQLEELQNQQRQAQQQAPSINEQDIISRLARNKPVDPSFFSLPKQEQQRLMDIANEIQAQQERSIGRQAVVQIEEQAAQSLTPELRKSIVQQAVQKGRVELIIPSFNNLVDKSKSAYQSTSSFLTPKYQSLKSSYEKEDKSDFNKIGSLIKSGYDKIYQSNIAKNIRGGIGDKPLTYFSSTKDFGSEKFNKLIYGKYQSIKEKPKVQQAINVLSGRYYAEAQALSGNKAIYDLGKGEASFKGFTKTDASKDFYEGKLFEDSKEYKTELVKYNQGLEFEREVQKNLLGQQLQSAVFASITGVPKLPKVSKIPVEEFEKNPYLLNPLKRQKDPLRIAFQETVIEKGVPRTEETYKIITEVSPPFKVLDSRKKGGLLGSSDIFDIQRAKYGLSQTVIPSSEKSSVVLSTKTGNAFDLDILQGASKRVDTKSLGTLPSTQEYLLKNLAVDKLGRPLKNVYVSDAKGGFLSYTDAYKKLDKKTSAKLVRDVLKGDEINLGNIITEDLGKLSKYKIKKIPEFTIIQNKRLKPSDYAYHQASQGKLKFRILPTKVYEHYFGKSEGVTLTPLKGGVREVLIPSRLKGAEKEITIAHELVHTKQPAGLFNIESKLKIPYRYQPSEIMAFGLEKRLARTGFKAKVSTGKVLSVSEKELLNIKYPKVSKTTQRTETISTAKVMAESEEFELYAGKTLFKDISKPTARASGKVPRLNELTLLRKEPRIIEPNPKDIKVTVEGGSNLKIYKPTGDGKKTPLSVTFGKQKLIQVPKPVPKIAKQPRTPKAKVISTKISPISSGVSSVLSRVSAGPSSSYVDTPTISSSGFSVGFGKGFEKIFPSSQGRTITGTQPLSFERNIPLEFSKSVPRELSININKQIPREIARNVPRSVPRSVPREIAREVQKQIPRQIPRQVPRQVPRQPPRNPLAPRLPPRTPPRTPKIPKFPSPKIKLKGDSKGIFKTGKQRLRYTPSFTGATRFNILGKKATVTSEQVTSRKGLPVVRGVILRSKKKKKRAINIFK